MNEGKVNDDGQGHVCIWSGEATKLYKHHNKNNSNSTENLGKEINGG